MLYLVLTMDNEFAQPTRRLDRGSTKEEGLPLEETNRSGELETEVDRYLVDHLGYDPEKEDHDTYGDLDINTYEESGEEHISLTYRIREDTILEDPEKQENLEELFEEKLFKNIDFAVFYGLRDSYLTAEFNYTEEDWIRGTEEVGDAVLGFETATGLSPVH